MPKEVEIDAAFEARMRNYTIADFHAAYARHDLSITQVTQFFLDRIETLNPSLHAVISVNPEALNEARQQDLQAGESTLPLTGIPLLIKDNIETLELPTTAGSLALADNWTKRDAQVVSHLRAAGAIILGKTNLSEWAMFRSTKGISGWSAVGGQVRNPHDLDRSPSGSSSGSAAGVSAFLCVAALGSETLGSIVSPSAMNGVVGLKPGVGLISQRGIVPISQSQDTAGPITRNVVDAAILLGVMAGAEKTGDYREFFSSATLDGKRLGVLPSSTGFNEEVDSVFERAISTLTDAGVDIVTELSIDVYPELRSDFLDYSLYEFKHYLNEYLADIPNELNKLTLASLIAFNEEHAGEEMPYFNQDIFLKAEAKGPLTESAYTDVLSKIGPAARECIDKMLQTHNLDAIIAPTGGPAWVIDVKQGDQHTGPGIITGLAAISGYPHITIPMGISGGLHSGGLHSSGLPIGFSFVGTAYDEQALLSLAVTFEKLLDLECTPGFRNSPV